MRPSRVLEQHAGEHVTRVRAAHDHKDVLVAVAIEIGERGAVSLLKMPEPALEGDLLEPSPFNAAEHSVGDDRTKIRVAGAEIEIEPAIVVDVAEIAAHRVNRFVCQP